MKFTTKLAAALATALVVAAGGASAHGPQLEESYNHCYIFVEPLDGHAAFFVEDNGLAGLQRQATTVDDVTYEADTELTAARFATTC